MRQRNKKKHLSIFLGTDQRIIWIITLVTNSYLSPWPHPLCKASLLWGFCHYGNHDISSMPVVRFCSREGVNEKRKWRIKWEAACKGWREINQRERERPLFKAERILSASADTLSLSLYVTRATAARRPAWLPSIPLVNLIDEVGPLDSVAISVPQQAMPHPISPLTSSALLL